MTINIIDIAYTRLKTPDVAAATDFATRILGLEPVDRAVDRLSFRSDSRMSTMSYEIGDPSETIVGFELANGEDLLNAAKTLEALGYEVCYGSHRIRGFAADRWQWRAAVSRRGNYGFQSRRSVQPGSRSR